MRTRTLIVLVLLVVVSACGRADDPDIDPTPTPAPPTDSPSPEPSPQAQTVQIYLSTNNPSDCAEVQAVEREVGGTPTLAAGMEQLLAGPTAEEEVRGLGGWFSDATRDMLISAEREGDVARVDFRDLREVIPNASSSCGSATLLAQLDSTAQQFEASRTLYSINGDVDAFYNWLQLGTPDS